MSYSQLLVTGVCAAATTLLGACAPFQAESFWGPAQNLSGLGTTFAWRQGVKCEPEASKANVPDVENAVQELIEESFTAKGYRRGDATKPDVYVCYRLGKVIALAETGFDSWDDAIIEVDLTDPATGGLVWRGRVRGPIDYAAAPDARKARLETAVRQLMKPVPKAGRR